MQIANEAFQSFLEHVGIDLRGRDVGVTEERLYDAQVRAVVQEVTGESMPQHMGAQLRGAQPGGGRKRLELAGKMLAGDMAGLTEGREQPTASFLLPLVREGGAG